MRATGLWLASGFISGAVGLAVSHLTAMVLTIRESPIVAIAEIVIRLMSGGLAEFGVASLGDQDKPVLVAVILLIALAGFTATGLLARRSLSAAFGVVGVLAALPATAVMTRVGAMVVDALPELIGALAAMLTLWRLASLVTSVERPSAAPGAVGPGTATRRTFGAAVLGLLVTAGAMTAVGSILGSGRRQLERTLKLLKLEQVTMPRIPHRVSADVPGVARWDTPSGGFYQVHTAVVVPTIRPEEWTLRIHGMVDHELTLTYQDLLQRQFTEAWVTLNCVSNPVGGQLVGNAWWSGVLTADLLADVGVHSDADAVLQTSDDGWTCSTPLAALTDDRAALVAVGMNGQPLPIDHGFPARTVVPGLFGYVSACKWVVDWEVTRFDRVSAFWTDKGWAEQAPVKLASRIDVPADGDTVPSGPQRIGGVAWQQHVGIESVEVRVDDGDWLTADLAGTPSVDTWVQWAATVDLSAGDHQITVRAANRDGEIQTGVARDVVPDGATGWHTVTVTAESP